MTTKTPITIAVMAKNEAHRLGACLETVRWADEVVVLDDMSTDQTVEIAKSYGAKCLKRQMDVEGRHRNFLYAQAKHEWVLSLDADEHVTPALADEISAVVKKNDPNFAGYSVPMKIYIGERWIRGAGYYPSARLKLFRRDKFKYEEARVHPRVFLDGKCGHLKGELMHYSFRDLNHFITKFNRETDLEADKWVKDGRRMSLGLALFKATDRFFRAYFTKKGYRDGYLGFLLSCFSSWYQLVTYAKYSEFKQSHTDARKKE
ncbi:MAG: hypothetical protein COV74_01935 [Candidatus Omnitrophica bacterium CG11_big_fil_rev_8_21_14_0_20_45_26]|uniref:Glycosyltransferase 2-like domain-containing protein n=1 Tax=Candidatus Abzuiibacterium crystallinum TaxID=1974748 RepID=A0A2H0LSH7_9BACT|nr:MAG: hypothetical protein COV74_01935 [Candidatus Omnitrophica bacterium CG11_big_fil_rev_8_21_14_0_20_45_26]PIW65057.1 MAG: hypothetical protein COW12_04215 [Candidatus Omnitrophica bacterium CG12_big_fil_rev_8_21_14_0_65_45_16]